MALSAFTLLYNQSKILCSSCKTETLPIKQLPILSSPQILGTTILFSISMNLTTLETSYKWDDAVFAFSLSMSSRFIHVVAHARTSSLRLNNIPLYYINIYKSLLIHILHIHSSIDEHLVCFHPFAMNMGERCS